MFNTILFLNISDAIRMCMYCYVLYHSFTSHSDGIYNNEQRLDSPPSSTRIVTSETSVNKEIN